MAKDDRGTTARGDDNDDGFVPLLLPLFFRFLSFLDFGSVIHITKTSFLSGNS